MKKNTSLLVLVMAAILLVMPLTAKAADDPQTGETYPEVFNVATFNAATATAIPIEAGYFDELPVPTKVLFFDSGRDINTAFAAGSLQAGTLGTSPASLGISNKLGYEVVFINDVIGPAESLAVRKSSGIKTIADLKGKKVATPFASTAHYSLLNALILEKVDPQDVTILDLQTQDILAAWIRGDIDGAYVWTPVLDELVKNDGLIITDSEKLAAKGILTADVSVVKADFAQKYPTLVTAYVKALVKGNDLLKSDPDQAEKLVAKNIGLTQAQAKEQLKGNNYLPGKDQLDPKFLGVTGKPGALADTLKNTSGFHVEQKNLEKAGDLSLYQTAVTGHFIEEALK